MVNAVLVRWSLLTVVAVCSACGDDPADVAGAYTVNVTNGANGCAFANWTVGASSSNIAVTVAQDGPAATASVGGLTGNFLDAWLGGHVFSGTVDGDQLDLTLIGTRAGSMGSCAYTFNAVIAARSSGDVLTGEIRYQAQTNGGLDCAALTGCASVQAFNGARPPR